MLLDHYMKREYLDRLFATAQSVHHEGYYVKMAVAWLISICFVKFYDETMAFMKQAKLDDFTCIIKLSEGTGKPADLKCAEGAAAGDEAEVMMELKKIISMIGGKILYGTEEILRREYSCAVASDLMSNVMLDTADDSILITSLVNPQVIRASEMMNITCIIITCEKAVTDAMIELAANRNIALVKNVRMIRRFPVYCGKLHSHGLREYALFSSENKHLTSIRLDPKRCIGCTHSCQNLSNGSNPDKIGKGRDFCRTLH